MTAEPPRRTATDRDAVAPCLGDAMAIVRAEGANRGGALARASARSIALEGRRDPFRYERFPALEAERVSRGSIYLLAQDDNYAHAARGVGV